ncbi:anti-sigma factor [Streptomyces sp. NPDC047803]|uniref:anti-sigma factor n=1 Tax=Streptomyces TaxID=1883 RepID=UPI0033C0499B
MDPHEASGAYALHALPEDERLAFERHLKGCPSCRAEVAELQAAAALLGQTTAMTPPPGLREEVFRRVALTPQEAPAKAREAAPPPRTSVAAQPVPVTSATGSPAYAPSRQPPRVVLAACVAAVLACLGIATWQYEEAQDARATAEQVHEQQDNAARVLTAPDVKLDNQEMRDGGTATVAFSRSENAATLAVSGLPPLAADKTYEAWFIEDGTPVPAGLLGHSPATGLTLLDGPVDNATAVALSVEPSGGSQQPTTEPLGAVALSA